MIATILNFSCPNSKTKNPEKINEEIKRNLEPNGKGGIAFHS
jgi:hypothetical protein